MEHELIEIHPGHFAITYMGQRVTPEYAHKYLMLIADELSLA